MTLAVVTRGYTPDVKDIKTSQVKIQNYVAACFTCQDVNRIYFAVNTRRDVGDTVGFLATLPVPADKMLTVIPVHPWGRYIEPLNAIMSQAATDGYATVLSANLEHTPTDLNIRELLRHLDHCTLAVGAWLPVFHELLPPGEYEMNGMRAPADAFMLLNLRLFALYGFQGVSEAPWVSCPIEKLGTPEDPAMKTAAGIKEVPAFSLIQQIRGGAENAQVKLVLGVSGAGRDATGITGSRADLDTIKRASAVARAAEQLRRACIQPGRTIYVNA